MIDEEKLDSALLQQRKIYLKGRIDREKVDKIAAMVFWLDNQDVNKEIILYIKSKGGNAEAGFDLYDILKRVKSPLTGIVFSEASSIAILALQSCGVRVMMRHAVLGFHDIDIYLAAGWRQFLDEAKKRAEMAEKEQNEYNQFLAQRSKIKAEIIDKFCRERTILSAAEAKEFNLIDEII